MPEELPKPLRRLVTDGLLHGRQYQDRPARFEYLLTDLGRSLRPAIVALAAWGKRPPRTHQRGMILIDADIGVEADPVLVDRDSGGRVDGSGSC